jgi:hypothetical protein
MHAYIALCLATGIRTEEARALTTACWYGSGAGNTLIGAMRGDSRESTMTIKGPETAAHERS